jgi:hypothetical protein
MKFFLIFLLLLSCQAQGVRSSNRVWRPATYRGLTVGKSKQADILRVFGKPRWSQSRESEDRDESGPEVWSNYERAGEFPGQTNVLTRNNVLERIDFYPAGLSKQQAIAHFGADYVITRYALDSCRGDEDSEFIYESPNGPLVSLEYRSRGIAISLGYQDLVTRIRYVSGPIGSIKSKCT